MFKPSRLMLGTAFLFLVSFPASAQRSGNDTSAGDSCAGITSGAVRVSGGAGGNIHHVCDGNME